MLGKTAKIAAKIEGETDATLSAEVSEGVDPERLDRFLSAA
jgi:hypothetical protein